MSSTFKFHSTINEVVPWQAQYSFPKQSTKVSKQTVKLVPKNGTSFSRNNIIRIEFPAENYLNVLNSVLQFDVTLNAPSALWTSTIALATGSIPGNLGDNGYVWHCAEGNIPQSSGVRPGVTRQGAYNGFPCSLVQAAAAGGQTQWNVIESIEWTSATTLQIRFMRPWAGQLAAGDVFSVFPQVQMQGGGAHNHFSRLRVLYGSLVLEDIQEYHTLVRLLTECAVQRDYGSSHGQILDGMASATPKDIGSTTTSTNVGSAAANAMSSSGAVAQSLYLPGQKRTFCINLLSGLLTQKVSV